MRPMRARWPLLVSTVCLLTGCMKASELPQLVDRVAFEHGGGTLFANPDLLTMKEIHLDNGTLAGREIILEGQVAEVSEHRTYLVLTDDSARMLVVLTELDSAFASALKDKPPGHLRVLGRIENGKKGLPYIMARAINVVADGADKPKA
jgi:hypothetical protein